MLTEHVREILSCDQVCCRVIEAPKVPDSSLPIEAPKVPDGSLPIEAPKVMFSGRSTPGDMLCLPVGQGRRMSHSGARK